MNITKLELANRISKKVNKPTTELKIVIETFLDEILNALAEGRRIEIRGFGVFKAKTRRERIGRNPRTGETVPVPSYVAPVFKFSKDAQKIFDKKLQVQHKPEQTSVPAFSSKTHPKKMKGKKPEVSLPKKPEPVPEPASVQQPLPKVESTAQSAEQFSPL